MDEIKDTNVNELIFNRYYPLIAGSKRPNVRHVNENTSMAYEDVVKLDDFGATLNPETVMIDIDNKKDSKVVKNIIDKLDLNCVIIQTTKGMHFHFKNTDIKNNKQNYFTSIGIKTETKFAHQNVVTPIKINGCYREIIRSSDKLDPIPIWLYPLAKKPFVDFANLEEGDGRNDSLYAYILVLQQHGFSKLEIKDTLKIINQFILKDPIDDKELEVIMRDEAFAKESYFDKNKFNHDKFSRLFLKEHYLVNLMESLYLYKDGVYTNNDKEIKRAIKAMYNNITSGQVKEVLFSLELIAQDVELSPPNKIPVGNGLLNLSTSTIEPFTHSYIATNKIPVNYNPNAYSADLDKALNEICCNDKSLRLVIEEMFGSTLYRNNEFNKLFILNGQGSNGKSTLLDLMRNMLGKDNVSSVTLKEFSKPFTTYQVMNKLANIGDDISDAAALCSDVLKKLVTGEILNVERKGKDPFDISNYGTMFFSSNHTVLINDTTYGMKRRVMNIPFDAKFTEGVNADYSIIQRARNGDTEFLEYMFRLSVEGLQRLLFQRSYTKCKAIDMANKEFERNNNPMLDFIEEAKIENESVKDVYLQYQTWCVDNGYKSITKIKFGAELKKYGYYNKGVRINGKVEKIWFKEE